MSLLDLVKKNRSYRGYDETRTITREELLDLVDLSRFTPSSINQQPLKYGNDRPGKAQTTPLVMTQQI